ncbi:DUF4124 domain-containing protein [Acinetobacter sp. 16]|uniref:DUF4124 domain-containing protein n=1 Tax=Acinetobacter sp. 16 TaxID=3081771 RepID=UPI00296EBBBB|nr:DUF4124 domain-containing protein [Acinetobacter sp. 16]
MSVLKITTFILLCIPVNLYAGVYKWVDAKGNVTYSSKPPPTGAKQQKIETIRSLGSAPAPQRTYSQSNRNSAQQSYQSQNYSQSQQPTRSTEDEALRQKIIQEASTPYKGAGGRLTANQQRTLAAMNGVNVSSGDSYSNSNSSYSAPMPQRQPAPTHMTSCDGSGCWDNQGNRYNGNNGTYYNNGRVCRDIGGQMQCN